MSRDFTQMLIFCLWVKFSWYAGDWALCALSFTVHQVYLTCYRIKCCRCSVFTLMWQLLYTGTAQHFKHHTVIRIQLPFDQHRHTPRATLCIINNLIDCFCYPKWTTVLTKFKQSHGVKNLKTYVESILIKVLYIRSADAVTLENKRFLVINNIVIHWLK